MKRKVIILLSLLLFLWGCADTSGHRTAVYMLLDTSGTYRLELEKAEAIVKYLLGTLNPGDSLAVARIDSGSFSEKDIIEKVTFDSRPSYANQQKRLFLTRFQEFLSSVKGSSHTDITGGILQAAEFLNETGAGRKYILIFSDLEEDLQKGQIRDIPLQLKGIRVVALNVTKLRTDNIDPRKYMGRLATWEKRVLKGGGAWKVVNDLDRLDRILSD